MHQDFEGLDTGAIVELVASVFLGTRGRLAAGKAVLEVRLKLSSNLFNCHCMGNWCCVRIVLVGDKRRVIAPVLLPNHDAMRKQAVDVYKRDEKKEWLAQAIPRMIEEEKQERYGNTKVYVGRL